MISNDLMLQFLTVVEAGSVTKAAEFLNVNPSSVSRALKKLEHEAGISLFRQQGRNLSLTPEGTEFYKYGRRILDDLAQFISGLKEKGTAKNTIRLATFEIFSTYFMAHLAQEHFPESSFNVVEKVPQQIEESILGHESDFGITYIPHLHEKLDHLAIGKSELRVYARKGSFKGLSSEEIPFAVPITPLSLNIPGLVNLDGWPSNLSRLSKYSFHQLQTAIETTKMGLSAIHIPEFLATFINETSKPEYQLIDITERFQKLKKNYITIYLVKRREDEENLIVKRMAKAIRMMTK